ncbi:Methyltransferase type 11 [Bacillus thuringiensis IBL 200]|nr:Methyltransferase type 11 [Bacillus thuringiensis IBL 200]
MKEKSQPLKCVFALSNKVKNNGSRFIILSSYFLMNEMMRKEKGRASYESGTVLCFVFG